MRDPLRIAGGIALGLGLATLPFLHSRWGLGHAHGEAAGTISGGHHGYVPIVEEATRRQRVSDETGAAIHEHVDPRH